VKKYSLGLLLLSLIVVQACGGNSDGRPNARGERGQQATSVETRTVSQQDISQQIRSFGTVQAQDIVQVTPQVGNRITRIYADLGDTVSQGERLASIYDATAQDQVQQARAQLEQSRANFQRDSLQYARQQKLLERDLISEAEFDNVRATYQNSKAQLQSNQANLTQSRENLENTIIRSPVYGVVLTRNVSQGDLASSGQVAFEIGNLTGLETRVYLPLEEWRRVQVGQKVNFSLSNEEQSTAEGSVTRISPRLDPTTGLGEVVIAFIEKGPSIFQGVLVETVINVETHEDAVVIPRSALVENVQTLIEPESNTIQIERTYSAFVVQEDSIAIKRDLKLGIEQGDKIEILSGLQANDQIVITGQTSLEDSSKVRVAGGNAFEDRSVPIGNGKKPSRQRSRRTQNTSSDSSSTNSNSN
jgi:RND family efflux transporter MFP subunit